MEFERLLEAFGSASRVTVMTGAGVSAASGIPTFRDAEGLWKDFRPEDLATPQAFARDPKLVWEWYAWRRSVVAQCQPNRAHEVLAAWSQRVPGLRLITQNVDGLHERAGTQNMVRFHGSLWEMKCWEECPASPASWWDERTEFEQLPPPCPHCSGYLRPGVVWFGEGIDPQVLHAAAAAAECEVFLTIGTSSVVYPAAALVQQAKAQGAYTVEINPEATPATDAVDLALQGKAEEVLDQIERVMQDRWS